MRHISFSPAVGPVATVRKFGTSALFSLAVCALATGARSARAQQFYEVGGGWNGVAAAPSARAAVFTPGFDLRASIGRSVAPMVRLRLDAEAMLFNFRDVSAPLPCPSVGCAMSAYPKTLRSVAGLTANGLVSVDPKGVLYLIGGVGAYNVNAGGYSLQAGGSAGGGIAFPVGARYRLVLEATEHLLTSNGDGPRWVTPISLGLRF